MNGKHGRPSRQQRTSSSSWERPAGSFSRALDKTWTQTDRSNIVETEVSPLSASYQADEQKEGKEGWDQYIVLSQNQDQLFPAGVSASWAVLPEGSASICSSCKGAGWFRLDVPFGHPQFGKPVECACLLERRRKQSQAELLALSELSEQQREQRFETFFPSVKGVQPALRAARQLATWLQTWGCERASRQQTAGRPGLLALLETWLVLLGPVGVGKTHLALAVANASLDAEIVTLCVTVPDLLDYLRAAFAPDAQVGYDLRFERTRNAELLVLDDLGTQRSSPWADEKLFQLINHRYTHRLPTIVTMNEQAWTVLDDRLQSRLSDRRLVKVVHLKGAQDYRSSWRTPEEVSEEEFFWP